MFMTKNISLRKAKEAKNDEFYTPWDPIEKEVNSYLEFNPDVFRGKTILLPADDPFESNFFKFFALHFKEYGLKKLIATSYDGSPIVNTQLSLFDDESEQTNRFYRAYKIELEDVEDINHNGVFNLDDVEALLNNEKYKLNHGNRSKVLSYLKGDGNYPAGDFRSQEVTRLRDQADIIITNPPFSLFREFMNWIKPTEKKFLVIGNNNAVTYKEIFPLIKNNIIWLGVHNGDMAFRVPDDYPPRKTRYWVDEHNQKWRSLGNIDWITNLDHGRRHQPLSLMSMEQNIRFSRHKQVREDGYVHYYNFDGIEVPYYDAIPNDYDGVMGVPITFLGKYNPEQFEIIGMDIKDEAEKLGIKPIGEKWCKIYFDQGGTGHFSPNMRNLVVLKNNKARSIYRRVLIRVKHPVKKGD